MKSLRKYITIAAISLASAVSGQNEHFATTVSAILANNPTLTARRASAEAEISGLKAENNLNDPEVEFEHQWGQPGVGNKWSITVSQSFDWPGVYRSRSKAATAGANAANLLYLAEEADMRLRVSQTLTDYIAAQQQLLLSQAVSDNITSIAEKISSAYNHGEATILDYRKICFEKNAAAAATDAAAALVENLRQELIALNGGKPLNLDSVSQFPQIELNTEDHYFEQQRANDPTLLAGDYLAEAARFTAQAAARSSLPGFTVGYIHNVETGDHFNGLKVGISLPFFANRHRKPEARAKIVAAENDLLAAELAVNQRVITDYVKAKNLDHRIARYSELFPAEGDDYLALLRKSLDGGQMSLVIYLYEVNYYIEARAAYINLLHERALTLLSLSRFD